MPNIIAVDRRPLSVADFPRDPWKNRGIKTDPINMVTPKSSVITKPTAIIGLRYKVSGINGLDARSSMMINKIAATAAIPNEPKTRIEPHPCSEPPHERPNIAGTTASKSRIMPM